MESNLNFPYVPFHQLELHSLNDNEIDHLIRHNLYFPKSFEEFNIGVFRNHKDSFLIIPYGKSSYKARGIFYKADGNKTKWLHYKDSKDTAILYKIDDTNMPGIILEGESDFFAANEIGLKNCITTLAGASSFTDEMNKFISELKLPFFNIIFDNDSTGKRGAEKFKKKLNENNITSFVIDISPLTEEKGDVRELIVEKGYDVNDFINLLKKQREHLPFKVYEGISFMYDEKFPEASPICDGLINKGELIIISGPAKVGKTFLVTILMFNIAKGEVFLNNFNCVRSKVLNVQTEVSEERYQKRLSSIPMDAHNLKDMFYVTSKRIKVDTEKGLKELEETIFKLNIDIVFLDSFYTLHNCNEDSSSEIAPVLSNIRSLAQRQNCAIVIVHHQGKSNNGGKQIGHAHRGSSSFADVPDGSLSLNPTNESRVAKLSFELRNSESHEPIEIKLNDDCKWEYVGISRKVNSLTAQDIRDVVKEKPGLIAKELKEIILNEFDVKARTIDKKLADARRLKYVFNKKVGRNVHYYLCESYAPSHSSNI